MRAALVILTVALSLWCCAHGRGDGSARTLAIVGATVVHPGRAGDDAIERDATVIVTGDSIAQVGPTATTKVPEGATIVDGTGRWVIPGLIDSHVHFFQSGNLFTRPDAADFNKFVPYVQEVARNKARLPATFKIWLASGVTSVVDVGGPMWNFEVRDAARASAAAPRVAIAGPLLSMIDRPQLALDDPPIIKVASIDEARALARRELAKKPDLVKVWFIHGKGEDLAAQEAIVRAAAEEAHAAGVRLAVHATELEVAKAALRAGADILVHSVVDAPVDAEFVALARERRAIYVPTLFVFMGYPLALSGQWVPTEEEKRRADPDILGALDPSRVPEEALPESVRTLGAKRPAIKPPGIALANLRAVHDAGIVIAMGTDAGNIGTVHGPSIHREMALMAQAGLSPRAVLASATVGGAQVLGLSEQLGDVAPGKLADLDVLDANPLADLANLAAVHAVVRGGRLFDPDELMRSIR